jgi:uncharacterized protein YneF (UPF0154 family)
MWIGLIVGFILGAYFVLIGDYLADHPTVNGKMIDGWKISSYHTHSSSES